MNESNDEEDSMIFYIFTLDYVPVSFLYNLLAPLCHGIYARSKPQYCYCYNSVASTLS